MGCDIHSHAERINERGEWELIVDLDIFDWRDYGVYGFLADVRNYSEVPPLAHPRGLPSDTSQPVTYYYEIWGTEAHSASWLSVSELLAFNYDSIFENRRVTRKIGHNSYNGGCTCAPGEGRQMTFREFLGAEFFKILERLKAAGAERVVFWFDN